MRIAIATDHGGFPIKNAVIDAIRETGHEVVDFGTDSEESVDYPDYVKKVGKAIQSGKADRGILLCGSGVGVCIAANKMLGIYASICHDLYTARQAVEHDNINVLCLGGRIIGSELTMQLVKEFLGASFVGNNPGEERHIRRIEKVKEIEKGGLGS
jgi:RpiB/LacA/LacB family sugar-phosphate isomerase